MKQILLIVSIVLLFSFCKHDCYRDLTSEEIRRLGYVGGEALVFKSNTGLYDTAIIGEMFEQKFDYEKKCKNKKYMLELSCAFKRKLYDSTIIGLPLSTIVYSPDAKSKDFVYPEVSFYGGYKFDEAAKGNVIINGKQFYGVYELYNQSSVFKCQKIYFSLEFGLLKVVYKDGTYWERINL